MGLIDKIKNIFKKNNHKLLEAGSQSVPVGATNNSKKDEFKKEIQEASERNLTPEQWQRKFFEEQNLGKYVKNPFIAKFLFSIPEINSIKDKESYENAKKENNTDFLFPGDVPMLTFTSNENKKKITVSFLKDFVNDSDIVEVVEKKQMPGEISTQRRKYDSKSGIEVERYTGTQIGNFLTETSYKRKKNSFGLVEKYNGNPEKNNREEGYFIDLTQKSDDIGTLDGAEKPSGDLYWEVSGEQEQKEYNNRLNEKINKSIQPNLCRKHMGIPEVEAERTN